MIKLGASWNINGHDITKSKIIPLRYVPYFFYLQKRKKQIIIKILELPKNTFSP
jgi:hypothetical protein